MLKRLNKARQFTLEFVVIDSALMMTGVAGTAGALGDGPESAKDLRETNASVTATPVFNQRKRIE